MSVGLAAQAPGGPAPSSILERELERHRPELAGYCSRILGSSFEAEDAVQDTLVRAWRGLDRLQRRATMRAWLYTIATNVCRDMLKARPHEHRIEAAIEKPGPAWDDPAEVAASREAVRLAFAAALRHLTARQRAALLLCEVLRWPASEVAALLGTSVASVTSALQRARATLAAREVRASSPVTSLHAGDRELLTQLVEAFERDDVGRLATLVREDVTRTAARAWAA